MGKRKHRQDKTNEAERDPSFQEPSLFDVSDLNHHKPEHNTAKSADDANNKQESGENQVNFITKWWQFVKDPKHASAVVAIFTIVIAVTGIIYSFFAGLQWWTMKGQLDQMQGQNRPYVFTVPAFSEKPPEKFHSISATVGELNLGNSPAVRESHIAMIAIDRDPEVVDTIKKCSFSYNPGTATIPPSLGPTQIGQTMQTISTRYITDEERDNLVLTYQEHIVLFGGIQYFGIKGGRYETRFCYIFDPKSITIPNTLPWHIECSCNHTD